MVKYKKQNVSEKLSPTYTLYFSAFLYLPGGEYRTWTGDLLGASEALSQLS